MIIRVLMIATVPALLFATVAIAQYPLLDKIAGKVVEKYEHATCEELWEKRREAKPPEEKEIVEKLHQDAEMRTAFIDRIAAPVANKMFECGMIP
jgi:hypothetical protein